MRPSLEIHVPISPTPRFFEMVHCLALSLRRFGGAYRDAPLVVTVGDAEIDPELEKRLPWLWQHGVEIRWVPLETFRRESWFATGVERFGYEFLSDIVLLLDADVLIADSFEDMVYQVHEEKCLAGLIAHLTPFGSDEGLWRREAEIWQELYDRCGLGPLRRPHQYSGWHSRQPVPVRECPPYFNFGVLCAPAYQMNRIYEVMGLLLREVDQVLETFFRCQIALSLAVTQLAMPYLTLPARFNFPTDREFEELYPREADQIRLVHLLGEKALNKKELFTGSGEIRAVAERRDLTGANEVARCVLAAIVDDFEADNEKAGLAPDG